MNRIAALKATLGLLLVILVIVAMALHPKVFATLILVGFIGFVVGLVWYLFYDAFDDTPY
jgi:hypothetical protein